MMACSRTSKLLRRPHDCVVPSINVLAFVLGTPVLSLSFLRARLYAASASKHCSAMRGSTTPAGGITSRSFTWDLLQAQDYHTSDVVITFLSDDALFGRLSTLETEDLANRDKKDGETLAASIMLGVQQRLLQPCVATPSYEDIDIMKLDAAARANHIIRKLPTVEHKVQGCAVILVGTSGTGKGSTVKELLQAIPNAAAWSNGNVLRAITLLALTHCKQTGKNEFDALCLTPDNLATWARMLRFAKHDGLNFDVSIKGLGIDALMSQIDTTVLKEPRISKIVPIVAGATQALVVGLARNAVQQMAADGQVVLLEGRAETLDHIDSPYRFRLVLLDEDRACLGKRRAAQRIMAHALRRLGGQRPPAELEEAIRASLKEVARSSGLSA